MSARRNLRHHAAVGLVRLILTDDCLRKDAPVGGHKRRSAVVAGGFEAQNDSWHDGHFASGPLPDPKHMH